MAKRSKLEVGVGFAIIVVSLIFIHRIYQVSALRGFKVRMKEVSATFSTIEGVSVGSDIKIGGVKIGFVDTTELTKELDVLVRMFIRNDIPIPSDSAISIASNGLLGGKYLKITPGGSDERMEEGSAFEYVQSSINLEELIMKFAMSKI